MKTTKSWREKMENPKLPKLVPVPVRMQKSCGKGTMLVPSPREVDEVIRATPKGQLTTVSRIREALAQRHQADVTCPLTTGIFIRVASEAAEEQARSGGKAITPYWRVVKDDGSLNPKFPGGTASQAERLRAEGHMVIAGAGRKAPRVASLDSVR
jgi:alkylated DNA nucleotide flippase Atl1